MYCVYGNSGRYIHGGPLFGGGPLLGGSVIGGSTVVHELDESHSTSGSSMLTTRRRVRDEEQFRNTVSGGEEICWREKSTL